MTTQNVSEAALLAVARNAVRHLNEADDHFKHERYASAMCSAVFSIEEAGKLGFMRATGKNEVRHFIKQIPFMELLKSLEDFSWLIHWQEILKKGPDADLNLSDAQRTLVADNPEFAEFVKRLRAGELMDQKERLSAFVDAMLAKQRRDGTFER